MQEEKLHCNITGKDVTFHKTLKKCGGENQCEHRMDEKCMQLKYRFKDKIEEIK